VICLVALSACSATRTKGATTSAGPSRLRASNAANSVWGGVYTLAQAEKGEASFRQQCASCHGRELEGLEDFCTPPLAGAEFWKRWGGQSVGSLYERIQTTMPENKKGSLSGDEYAAIVSFVLKANELPPGEKDLPSELATLNRITMTNRSPKP
jgi:mono/diheme cytochrome c family protein